VCVAEYRLFNGALLQKSPIILRSVLIVATPQPHFKERTNRSHPTATFLRPIILRSVLIVLRSVLIVATPQPHFKERTNRFKERTNRSHTTATF